MEIKSPDDFIVPFHILIKKEFDCIFSGAGIRHTLNIRRRDRRFRFQVTRADLNAGIQLVIDELGFGNAKVGVKALIGWQKAERMP